MKSKINNCCNGHCSSHEEGSRTTVIRLSLSFIVLISGIVMQHSAPAFFRPVWIQAGWFAVGWLLVALPILRKAWETLLQKDFFNEFTLMLLASGGAFYIGEYPEALAVLLFYAIGELFQDWSVDKARNHIRSLMDIRPQTVTVLRNGKWVTVAPEEVGINETIEVKTGERVPLDSVVLEEGASFNTAALTGESIPRAINRNEEVLAGMIPADRVVKLRTLRKYTDSSLARIFEMVENATSRKAPTERFIRKFARIYTPVVTLLALLLVITPWLYSIWQPMFVYDFHTWLYRALIFLVVSCPCALVISVPLSYFGGIGAASRRGILFKGSNYLDALTHVNSIVFDKTGTLTCGVFDVQEIHPDAGFDADELLRWAAAAEAGSNHPIARAVCEYAAQKQMSLPHIKRTEEIPGWGLRASTNQGILLVGKAALLEKYGITYPENIIDIPDTIVTVALDNRYVGYLLLADQLKPDAPYAIESLKRLGIRNLCILSGDKSELVRKIARQLGVSDYSGDLMPEDKVKYIEQHQADGNEYMAFVGDGINDAPVLATGRVGIAMGKTGSDVAIETADIVLQTDQPSKVAEAISLARRTRTIVWQNIIGAIGVKVLVMALGALGFATLWEAVFADVGVTLLAILNTLRLLSNKKD